jgi:myo-inositol 2-dehydrogenase / D-chiro-inositol 1-dehydrogenase
MTPISRTHVRFGLIGYGLFGKHHAAAIQRATNAELVGIAVRSESSRTVAGAEHPRVTIHEHYEELLARDDVDVIDIVVPNHLHFPMALAALKSGKHVLLEKPMALTVEQCANGVDIVAFRSAKVTNPLSIRCRSRCKRVPNS